MRTAASTLCILFTACLLPLAAHAAQTFNTGTRGGGQDFAYTYNTADGQARALQFRLNLDDIRRGSEEFRRISTGDSQAYRLAAMQKVAQGMQNPNLDIRLTPIPNGIDIAMRGRGIPRNVLEQNYKVLEEAGRNADSTFLANHMYAVARSAGNVDFIRPDHAAIAKRYTGAMQPVAQAILQQVPGASQNPRAFINAALNWLQTIPYDTLDNRTTSNGAGFQTPYGLILGNMGDCDSKATALAALIRAAYPSLPLTIIYVPDHAFLGVGLPQTDADYALSTQHGIFVLADATGPRLSPLGQIDTETRDKLKRQSSKTELVPIR
ncbi:MAG: hypothetical protein EON60_14150 [Alphaproteobacteria bacterium]|nr:MAG: hypothetical protein EON60_14150 [Alphaproteobacteria bacterium]